MKKEIILKLLSSLIALLFFYAAVSKLINFDNSKHEMLNQVFSRSIAMILVWVVPATELVIVCLLLLNSTRLKGFYASLILLSAFTIYIVVTMSGVFGRIPCSCGGILRKMGYWTHFFFNLLFIVLALAGIAIDKLWLKNRFFMFVKRKEVPGT